MASADRKMERGHREGGLMVVVLITGGTGFIGSMLARQLIKQHYSVYIATHRDDFDRNRVEGAKYVTGDIRVNAHGPFVHSNPKIVIHLAALTPVRFSYSNAWNYYYTNVVGTANVVHEALTTRVRQFIMASTAEVYPYTKEKVYWRESDNLSVNAASSPYAASKRGAEEVVKEAGERGLNYTILRCTNTYGRSNPALPEQSSGYFIEKAIISMLRDEKEIKFDGYPESERQWMYWQDHVNAYLSVVENEKAYRQTINFAPDAAYSCGDVVKQLQSITHYRGDITWGHNPRPIDPNMLLVDNTKSKEIGWRASYRLADGLALAVQEYRKILGKILSTGSNAM
jgi:dTDP-glucose 4,6-dehydratase